MPIRITKPDGCILTVSSWSAWRELHEAHSRGPCSGCDGEGFQEWLIEGGAEEPDRWFPDVCRECRGAGFRTRGLL